LFKLTVWRGKTKPKQNQEQNQNTTRISRTLRARITGMNKGSAHNNSVILSEAKDLRRNFGLNCPVVVFNDNIGENQESVSSKIDSSEVLREKRLDLITTTAPSAG
jgi:hypothetical protein